ncbi:MAG: hypothetical protein KGJ32_06555 [Xanthomonadaceae bacterium]|nr:hypothetical protein [Xanthomonadaceae bacterium]
MTDKTYYQAAATEVAGGQLDVALWTKVNADMPEATDLARQAKYIQLRAREMAHVFETTTAIVWSKKLLWWLILSICALIAFGFVADVIDQIYHRGFWRPY